MKICIISGSSRKSSQSLKVAEFMRFLSNEKAVEVDLIDLHQLNLPAFDPDNKVDEIASLLRERLDSADGFILISPEWDGMVNHRIISFLHYVGKEMADKPVMLIGVSSSFHGGHYPVEQMRMLGPKNKHYVIIPEHLVIMNVENVMNSHDYDGQEADVYIKKRAAYATTTLIAYADALAKMRSSGAINPDTYPNGM